MNTKRLTSKDIDWNVGWKDGAVCAVVSCSDNRVDAYLDATPKTCMMPHGDIGFTAPGCMFKWSKRYYYIVYKETDSNVKSSLNEEVEKAIVKAITKFLDCSGSLIEADLSRNLQKP